MSDYITLASSNGGISKRFWAEDMGRSLRRAETSEEQTGGALTVSKGRARDHYQYTLFVPHTPADANFGSLEDLRRLWRLNNPTASPSDVLTLTRHDGMELEVRALGDLPEKPYSVQVESAGAYYTLDIELVDVTRPKFKLNTPAGSMFLPLI